MIALKNITVKELRDRLDQAVKAGLGDLQIVISDDNEGNGFHGLFYGLTFPQKTASKEDKEYWKSLVHDSCTDNLDDIVFLG